MTKTKTKTLHSYTNKVHRYTVTIKAKENSDGVITYALIQSTLVNGIRVENPQEPFSSLITAEKRFKAIISTVMPY